MKALTSVVVLGVGHPCTFSRFLASGCSPSLETTCQRKVTFVCASWHFLAFSLGPAE